MENEGTTNKSNRWNNQFAGLILLALGIGAFGFAELINYYAWMVIATFHEYWRHPYGYPFTIAFGALCLIIVLILFVCWIIVLVKSEKKLIGFFTSLICVVPGCSFGFLIYIGTYLLGEWVKGLLQLG